MKKSNNCFDSLTDYHLEIERLFAQVVPQYDEDNNKISSTTIGRRILDAQSLGKIKSPSHRAMALKCNMKDRIIARVETMAMPYFFTITFNNETLNEKDYKRVVRRTLKTIGITKYVLITDYGEDYGRLHYHGYIDIIGIKQGELIDSPTKKYPTGVQLVRFTKNIGFNLGTPLRSAKSDLKKTIAYTLKYIVKDNQFNFKHSMFASRELKEDIYKNLPF